MYQRQLSSGTDINPHNLSADQQATTLARLPPPNGSRVAASHASQTTTAPTLFATTTKTFEQVYKDVLEQKFGSRIAESNPSGSQTVSAVVTEPTPSSSKKKDEYITTVYNITPREMSSMPPNQMTSPGTILLNNSALSDGTIRPNVVPSIPTTSLTVESHQKPQTNAYAKQLHTLAFLAADSKPTNPQIGCTINKPKSNQTAIYLQHTTEHAKPRQEIYRHIQLQPKKKPTLKADAIMLSKHRTNVMLAIVKPKITTPAPTHVYGAPEIGNTTQQQQQPPKQYSTQLGRIEGHRLQTVGAKVTVEYINEPPPAHSVLAEAPKATFKQTTSTAPSITPKPVPNGQSQDEALNLDMKRDASYSTEAMKLATVPSFPTASKSTQEVLNRPTALVKPSTKECLLAAASTSTAEPITNPTTLVNPSTKESFLGTASHNSTREPSKHSVSIMNYSAKEKLFVAAHINTLNRLAAVAHSSKAERIHATASTSTGEPPKQLTTSMNQSAKESLPATASSSITQQPPTQLAIPTNPSTIESPLAIASSSIAREPLKQSGSILNQSANESLLANASHSIMREQPKQPAINSQPVINPSAGGNNTTKIVQNVTVVPSAPVPLQANAGLLLEQLKRYNLQHLLAHAMLQANRADLPQERIQTSSDHTAEASSVNMPMAIATQGHHQANPSNPHPKLNQHPFIASSPSTMTKLEYEQLLYQKIEALKRKIPPKDADPNKKRRSNPRPKRPTEAFLQNGPCYKVASRLPRCRECGRSAAVRSRNASIIFCRFIAFRKLKYNDQGQLEVYGFADPVGDAKEADTSLWSSNLQKVPADLTVEKSKFLLGQVGYKFCELFHQEKEAYFEHMAEDKTVAWKQPVQGVREMCDVCQTTLFNHHWVCSTCGFVVCIDCYKYRKNGIIAVESTAKDKDTNGWLLCSGSKEPHDQQRLLLTQIIPSKCLYTLVRQMHGICALLEIPLNCDCPLMREPALRTIKDQLKFIYPLMPEGSAAALEKSGGEVSVTIKQIEQMGYGKLADDMPSNTKDPIECRIVFTQQYRESKEQPNIDKWNVPPGQDEINESSKEKRSYSFDGFEQEIHADGDHFDERLYKISNASKAEIKADTEKETEDENKMVIDSTDEERVVLGTNINESIVMNSSEANLGVSNEKPETNGLVNNLTPNGAELPGQENGGQESSGSVPLSVQPASNGTGSSESTAVSAASLEEKCLENKPKEVLQTVPVPYSEEDRFKSSPTVDKKTVNMIIKQVVKTDKSIFQLMQPHMMSTRNQLNDFVECISIQRERVKQFVAEFLDEFIFLKGQHSSDDLSNERVIVDYNRSMKEGIRYRNKGERKMNLVQSKTLYSTVAHEWLCNGKLLRLLNPLDVHNYRVFHEQWERGQPVMVSAVSSKMNMDLWLPASFGRDFGEQMNDLINCLNGKIVRGHPMRVFWEGFEQLSDRLMDERERPMMLKLKDWPPGDDFAEMMPTRFYDLMKSLPLAEYTRREGRLNLASRLSSFFVRPDLGPKMYSAYGSALHPSKGTTNLHLDISDAVNVMVYVGVPKDVPRDRYNEKIVELIDSEDCDYLTRQRVRERKELPGALWHIYHAQDADKIRTLLNKIELEKGGTIKPNHDPIHDQKWYLDRNMRKRLQQEYQVEGYAIVQCSGDAIFIPAGAPHQVRNLHNCVKVAEDFVSPENISHCLKLTNEFRHLSGTHSNHEDKLQIKNIIYHTVKDAVSCITNPLIRMARDEDKV
uniref:[histone H3]-dimethyl-L-lysine(9) demethylase n=1 Tax=Anopheles christyi TaxID=43041 RepID=A0A182JNM9_9DIPT